MIQRIQTLYLILAVASLCVLFLAPISSYADAESISYILSVQDFAGSDGTVVPAKSNLGMLILGPLAIVTILYMIFQFKDRNRQMLVGRAVYLLLGILIILAWFFIESNKYDDMQITGYGLGYFAPVAALPFVFLANRSIKKDQELVKSLDRLR